MNFREAIEALECWRVGPAPENVIAPRREWEIVIDCDSALVNLTLDNRGGMTIQNQRFLTWNALRADPGFLLKSVQEMIAEMPRTA